MKDKLDDMWARQHEFQTLLGTLDRVTDEDTLVEHVKDNVLAAYAELTELLNECDWKAWARGKRTVRAQAMLSEAVDVWCFLCNIMLGLGVKPDEFYQKYQDKMAVNFSRQEAGYSHGWNKCSGCGRALDDSAVECTDQLCAFE